MRLKELLEGVEVKSREGDLEADILDITDDSRRVTPGGLFIAVKGFQVDGHGFVKHAVAAGAAGVMVQDPFQWASAGVEGQGPEGRLPALVSVDDTHKILARIAAKFFHYPSRDLLMVGITGTNGKTTVTYLSQAVLKAGGKDVGVLGTTGYFFGGECIPASHTTPTPIVLQSLLGRMVAQRLEGAVLEVSSHALALDRVDGCEFDIAVFTNLTQDHLDFHENMESYFQAKCRLFTDFAAASSKTRPRRAIINIDDAWGARMVQMSALPVWTYGLQEGADIRARNVSLSMEGTTFTAETPQGAVPIVSALVGEHNVYNLLAAIGVGLAGGVPLDVIHSGIRSAKAVPGRFERVEEGQDFLVVVDYAHTEDALARLLTAAKALKPARILTVFGCGGDRDKGKRPKMGAIAAKFSDVVFVTSDNPRSEEPASILQDIQEGMRSLSSQKRAGHRMIVDRRTAIHQAIGEAQTGDMVIIAGKGHEDYQIVGVERHHFDDREVAREAIQLRVKPAAGQV